VLVTMAVFVQVMLPVTVHSKTDLSDWKVAIVAVP
jgi:hypothetical protein